MARHDLKPEKARTAEPDPELLNHLRSLGLRTMEEYQSWCVQNGFSRRTDKHWRLRLKESARRIRG
jgi:hypothetical protein